MWRAVEVVLRPIEQLRCRRNVRRALALHDRGEARSDGLTLVRVRNRLEIRWRSRDVHPWDAGVAPEGKAQLFQEQLAADTETAIFRLFDFLPQIDRIDLQVLEPATDNIVLAGTVHRSALADSRKLRSVGMRLRQLGVSFAPADYLRP